jgi:hypothetical protein
LIVNGEILVALDNDMTVSIFKQKFINPPSDSVTESLPEIPSIGLVNSSKGVRQ